MATHDNIDHFNRIVILVLHKLYSQFPVAEDLDVAEIAELAFPGSLPPDPKFEDIQPAYESIEFLKQEGFLTYLASDLSGASFSSVKLTLKGLNILGVVPASLEKKQSLISHIKDALTGGLKEAGSEVSKQLVAEAFKLAPLTPAAIAAMTS